MIETAIPIEPNIFHHCWAGLRTRSMNAVRAVSGIVWPDRCVSCGSVLTFGDPRGVCRDCLGKITPWPRNSICSRCGYPLDAANVAGVELACRDCREGSFLFDRARAVTAYEGMLQRLVQQYKFGRQARLYAALGRLMLEVYRHEFAGEGVDLVTFVPLHPRRLRERGFDQAELLARFVARKAGRRCRRLLRKVRPAPPQSELAASLRPANIRHAYAVTRRRACAGKSILLVDDIFTTGATLDECCRVLTRAGAARIFVLTLARVRTAM